MLTLDLQCPLPHLHPHSLTASVLSGCWKVVQLCPLVVLRRGLFEKDKLVFSFLLCGEIMKTANQISGTEWNFFLRGAAGTMDKVQPVQFSYSLFSLVTAHSVH